MPDSYHSGPFVLLRFRKAMEFIIITLSIPVEDIGIIVTHLLLYMKWMTMLIPLSNESALHCRLTY